LIGDCGVGAVTFNVEPSDAVLLVAPAGSVGVRGVLDFDVHASVKPRSTAIPVTGTKFRDIKGSRNEKREPGELVRMIAESADLENMNFIKNLSVFLA
jgi:hypothetical protein